MKREIYQKVLFAEIVTAVYSDAFAEKYNLIVDLILTNAKIQREFMTILEEQKSICIEGGMPEVDAEKYICNQDNLRRTAMFFLKENYE
jgi:hypothetical protein